MNDYSLWFNDYLSILFGNNCKINPWFAQLSLFKSDHFSLYFKRGEQLVGTREGNCLKDQAVKVSALLGHRQHLV